MITKAFMMINMEAYFATPPQEVHQLKSQRN